VRFSAVTYPRSGYLGKLAGVLKLLKNITLVGVFALSISRASCQAPFVSSCGEDGQIDGTTRKTIDSVAMNFIQTMLGPNPSSAYDLLSKDGQAGTSREQLEGVATKTVRPYEPKNLTVEHTYLIKLKGNSPGRVVCSTDLSKPEGWESLAAKSIPEQAHVSLSADTRNNKLAFVAWLVPEQRDWKVETFWVNISALADKDSVELWNLARAQQTQRHSFNAALLYAAAGQTANRGPNFQLGVAQSIADDMSKLSVPFEIRGQPPFSWGTEEATYKVINVGPIAVGGKIYVTITHEVPPSRSDKEMDALNRKLISYFKRRFPEYSDVFAGVVARAVERGSNRGYGTVDALPALK
jgi:hypothetical protein